MPTVVDSLIVTLGLDTSAFTKGQKDAAEALLKTRGAAQQAAKSMESDGARAASFFSQIKVEALSLIGILIGGKGIESFVRETSTSLRQLGFDAKSIGEDPSRIAALEMAIKRLGGTAEGTDAALQSFATTKANAQLFGDASFFQQMALIGGNAQTSPIEALKLFVDYIQKNKGTVTTQQIEAIAAKLFPGIDRNTLQVLESIPSSRNLEGQINRSFELGAPTAEQIRHANEFLNAIESLSQAIQSAGRAFLDSMYPGMTNVILAMTDFIVKNPALVQQIIKLTAAVIGLGTALAALGAIRLTANAIGLTGIATAITGIITLASRLVLIFAAWEIGKEALHISGAGEGEQDEINRERAAHGGPEQDQIIQEHPAQGNGPVDLNPPQNPAQRWISGMREGPVKHFLQRQFGLPSIADNTMTPEQQSFLQTLSEPESGGAYNVKNGGSTFVDYSQFPQGVGPGGTSTAAGRYQFTASTWAEAAAALGIHDFSPVSQDRAAWWLAEREYRQRTGGDLGADLAQGGHESQIASALRGRWPSLPGGSQSNRTLSDFASSLKGNNHPPMPTPPAPPPVPPVASASPQPASGDVNTNTVTVGNVVVNTQATDAKGVARAFSQALVLQANRGPV